MSVQLVVPPGLAPSPTPSTTAGPPPDRPSALPRTGADLLPLVLLAVLLLTVGAALVAAASLRTKGIR